MQLSWKKSFLVIFKILGLFVNTFSADDKYPLLNRDNLSHHLEIQLSYKQKTSISRFFFFLLLLHLRNVDSILSIFKKKVDPHSLCIFKRTYSEKYA